MACISSGMQCSGKKYVVIGVIDVSDAGEFLATEKGAAPGNLIRKRRKQSEPLLVPAKITKQPDLIKDPHPIQFHFCPVERIVTILLIVEACVRPMSYFCRSRNTTLCSRLLNAVGQSLFFVSHLRRSLAPEAVSHQGRISSVFLGRVPRNRKALLQTLGYMS